MERKFILSCCSTVDLPYSHMAEREIPVQFYTYVVDGETYVDDMGRDSEALPRFYRFLEEGKLPQTSQINVAAYTEFFEALLQKGDVLHVAFTSGQSGSVNNAFLAAQELSEKYPDRTICVVELPRDGIAIEKCGIYQGVYHVLQGHLNPVAGVNPEHLRIDELLTRLETEAPREVILALNPTTEGDATTQYLAEELRATAPGLKITNLARGLASGVDIETAALSSLMAAVRGRIEF